MGATIATMMFLIILAGVLRLPLRRAAAHAPLPVLREATNMTLDRRDLIGQGVAHLDPDRLHDHLRCSRSSWC